MIYNTFLVLIVPLVKITFTIKVCTPVFISVMSNELALTFLN